MCHLGYTNFSCWVIDAVNANRREANGGCEAVTEQLCRSVPDVGVYEHARYNLVAVEGHSIGVMRPIDTCITRFGEPLFRQLFNFIRLCTNMISEYLQQCQEDFSPVSNGWKTESFGAQNISLCIRLHCGVERMEMFGLFGSLIFDI